MSDVQIFKMGETVALKNVPTRPMRIDAILEGNLYKCSYPMGKVKRESATYSGDLLQQYRPPNRGVRLVDKRDLW